MRDAVDRLLGAGQPAVPLGKADAQIGARADKPDRAEAPLVERGRALLEALDVLAPGGDGIRLVESRGRDHRVPEPLDVGLAEDGASPPFVGVAEDRPLDQPAVLGVEELLDGEPRSRPLGAALVEVGEQLGLGLAGDDDRRATGLDQVVDERHRPGRAPVEGVVGRVLDHRPPQVRVAVDDLDVAGAALVRDAADGADQREMLRIGRDPQELPRLEVDGDLDRKA